MTRGVFILNARTGVLHHYPASEACNIDAIPKRYRLVDTDLENVQGHKAFKRICKRCNVRDT